MTVLIDYYMESDAQDVICHINVKAQLCLILHAHCANVLSPLICDSVSAEGSREAQQLGRLQESRRLHWAVVIGDRHGRSSR